MRAHEAIRTQYVRARGAVVRNLRYIGSKLLLCMSVDLNHLEGRAYTARAQTRYNPIVPLSKTDYLFFCPEPSRGRRRKWKGFTEEFREAELQLLERGSIPRLVRHAPGEYHARPLAEAPESLLEYSV